METQHITIVAKAHNGKVTIHTDIPVSGTDETYVVTIAVAPQSPTLDELYGALADTPLPEIPSDLLPEQRDEL